MSVSDPKNRKEVRPKNIQYDLVDWHCDDCGRKSYSTQTYGAIKPAPYYCEACATISYVTAQ